MGGFFIQEYIHAAEQISLFCRINVNVKKAIPIRSSEMGLLIYLVKTDGENTPMDAARFFKVTKAMITNMVTSLIKKGYIQKQQSKTDKRSYILIPTDKSISLVEETYTEYFKTMALLKGKMGDSDFDTLITMIGKANTVLLEEQGNG